MNHFYKIFALEKSRCIAIDPHIDLALNFLNDSQICNTLSILMSNLVALEGRWDNFYSLELMVTIVNSHFAGILYYFGVLSLVKEHL